MKNTAKSTLILIITLLLGILIGGFGHRAYMRSYFNQLHTLRANRGVERMLLRRIDPTEEQRPKVEKVVQKYGTKIDSMRQKHHKQSRKMITTLMAELKPLLTKSQLERVRHAPPGRKRLIDGLPPPPPLQQQPREKRVRRLMSILQPDSTVSDTVRSIIEEHMALNHKEKIRRDNRVPDGSRDLRIKLEPYFSSGCLDTLELRMRPSRPRKEGRQRPPRDHPRF